MSILATEQLRPSRLSDQLETFNTDVDIASLNIAAAGRASFPLLERVTAATITRTIEGASTIEISANDYDRALLNSGYVGPASKDPRKGFDIELDGLWFRLWSWSKNGDTLSLTFIDREVAVLKQWPPVDQPDTWWRAVNADAAGLLTRYRFAERLIQDVQHILPIRFRCPPLDGSPAPTEPVDTGDPTRKGHGFASNATVTVQGFNATPSQMRLLAALLALTDRLTSSAVYGGKSMSAQVARKIMITAVAVVTQESKAGADPGNDPTAVGPFQQNPQFWPATGNVVIDGGAFVNAAINKQNSEPNLTVGQLGDAVQNPKTHGLYDQWVPEATTTVDEWLGTNDVTIPASALVPTDAADPLRGQFTRGKLDDPRTAFRKHRDGVAIAKRTILTNQGNKLVVREDNWACLARLAAEIGWRCFCVSGTVYFIDDYTLFHQKIAMSLSEQTDGVDSLDPDFTQGKATATIKAKARIGRWKAAPGSAVGVEDLGLQASGRWLVGTVSRSLFDPDGEITLQKPASTIPESAAPEHGAGQGSGVSVYTPPNTGTTTGGTGGGTGGGGGKGSPAQRVQVAQQLLKQYGTGWFDDNGRGLAQIRKVAQGQRLTNAAGNQVDLDVRTMQVLLRLIDLGFQIGTFAWCEDHHDDGANGHAGGRAVDISSIRNSGGGPRISIANGDPQNLGNITAVANLLHSGDSLQPRQLICGGYGNTYVHQVAFLCIPNAATFDYVDSSGRNVLRQEHTNHIHVGF